MIKRNRIKIANGKRLNVVKLNDIHFPFADYKAVNVALAACRVIKPQIIVLDEIHDFYSLSRFDKDPKRIASLQEELDEATEFLRELRTDNKKARIILMDSNHLRRLRKYLWSKAPGLSSLRSLRLKELLELEKWDVEYKDVFMFRDFLFKHGDIIRKFAAYTAKGEHEKEGVSGMSGHSHRIGQHYSRKRGGFYTWIESGCLCDLNPEYIEGVSDWQHAIGLVSFKWSSKHFVAYPIPIVDYQLLWADKTILYK